METKDVFVVYDKVRITIDYVSSLELLCHQAMDRLSAQARLGNKIRDYQVTTLEKALQQIHLTYTYRYEAEV